MQTPPPFFFSTIINQIISVNLFHLSLEVFSWVQPGVRKVSSFSPPTQPARFIYSKDKFLHTKKKRGSIDTKYIN